MKNLVIILDPAHGADVKGKCSPDGTHKEYLWSRERVHKLETMLIAAGYKVFLTTDSDNEPGLSKRKEVASKIEGSKKLLISLHNNAAGDGSQWLKARGIAVYTTKGETKSDECAEVIIRHFEKDFPELKMRKYSPKKMEEDFEENFTVLMGSNYMAVLIEWLFQDNKEDVELLGNPSVNRRMEYSLLDAIEEINNQISE